MALKVFSKRHPEDGKEVVLSQAVRTRIWYLFEASDTFFQQDSWNTEWTFSWHGLPESLMKEHGWQQLRSYKSKNDWVALKTAKEFILQGVARFILDATELYYDILDTYKNSDQPYRSDPSGFQSELNIIFDDANLSWRMLEGRIIRIDSKWLEAEVHARAAELLKTKGFNGALAEFQQARSELSRGNTKGAIHAANLAVESTMKGILGIEKEKPGVLIRKLIDSGLVPEYHEGFLKAFEEHILRSVSTSRNLEKGVGHGQGQEVSDPPKSLADLAVNLAGVLILFLLKRHLEAQSQEG